MRETKSLLGDETQGTALLHIGHFESDILLSVTQNALVVHLSNIQCCVTESSKPRMGFTRGNGRRWGMMAPKCLGALRAQFPQRVSPELGVTFRKQDHFLICYRES